MGEDDDYWVIRIRKPKRLIRGLRASLASFAQSKIVMDIPMMISTSLLIGVISFIILTLFIRIPEIISLIFSLILVVIYLAEVTSYFRR